MIKEKLKTFLYHHVLPHGGLLLLRLITSTYRPKLLDTKYEDQFLDKGKGVIYASWHQRFLPGANIFSKRKPIAIMISQSRDGELVARIAQILGWLPIRGSSSRGGPAALKQLKKLGMQGYKIGHIVDGPRGPFGVIKPGLIRMAQFTGLPIIPVIISAQNKWVFEKSWDRFMVPKPFSRIIFRFCEPIDVPRKLDKDQFEQERKKVENTMKALYEDTDKIWTDKHRFNVLFR